MSQQSSRNSPRGNAQNVRRPYRSERKKRRAKRIFLALLVIFTVAIVITLSRTLFFFISDFSVSGNRRYTDEELMLASGIDFGENLFVADKKGAKERICRAMPYVETAKVKISLPSTIKIEVVETTPVCLIYSGGAYYIADENSKILEIADDPVSGLIPIRYEPDLDAKIGERYFDGDQDAGENLKKILNSLKENSLSDNITYIDITDKFDIRMGYNDNLALKIGMTIDLDKKFIMLKSVLPKIFEDEKGVIDLTNPAKAFFESQNN